MQRDAIGPLEDGGDDIARRRTVQVEDLARHERGFVEREAPKSDLFGEPFGQESCAPLPHGDAWVEFVAPIRGHDEQWQTGEPAGKPGKDLQAEIVRVGQVLQGNDRRSAPDRRQELDDVEDQQPALTAAVTLPDVLDTLDARRDLGADRGEGFRPRHGSPEVEERGRGDGDILRGRVPADGAEPQFRGTTLDRAEQSGLADARLAGEQQEPAIPRPGFLQPPVGHAEEIVAAEHDRAESSFEPAVPRRLPARRRSLGARPTRLAR